jgi:hypothetical protein
MWIIFSMRVIRLIHSLVVADDYIVQRDEYYYPREEVRTSTYKDKSKTQPLLPLPSEFTNSLEDKNL